MKHDNKPQWYKQLQTPPFDRPMFTPEMEQTVLDRQQRASSGNKLPAWMKRCSVIGAAAAAGVALVLTIAGNVPGINQAIGLGNVWTNDGAASGWRPHSVYYEGEKPLIEAFPGGDYRAGRRAGCWWNLSIPYEQLKDSTVEITATHRQSGRTISELPPTAIIRSMSYDNFTRVPSDFALPLSGTWKFDVYIDGQKKGDLVFEVPDSDWNVSPNFVYNKSVLTGNKMEMGFVSSGFTAGQPNKFLWHLFAGGEKSGSFRVDAVKKGTTDVITILNTELSGSKLHQTLPSTMQLPEAGLWRLLVYVDGKFYDSMVVEAKAAAEKGNGK
ncbi:MULTISPECIES: DUF4871 domain-containing protein [Paenibacillus]|uniref:DUF4871 domain-containing protein n=1 Tax=Paenibacillus albilobatus TaxID=2716884 RepID=A0A920CDN8_9BACL|nr:MULTISPECIES: DUF4871 domain-containing protein [Paenibacillus]GIO34003.1 hypothetical protein J2TS6_51440 [Paenibacillus albilobatus]